MTNADKIQAVLNTIALLQIPATRENADHILGIYNTLLAVRNDLDRQEGADNDGSNQAE